MKVFRMMGVMVFLVMMVSCVGIRGTRDTYSGGAGEGVKMNGAVVRMRVKPEGTSGGSFALSAMVVGMAVANLDGPFRWRLEAEGVAGEHESLVLHRVRTRTAVTKRDEWYPQAHLGKRVDFSRKKGSDGPVRAVYDIPGLLKVKPSEDGALEVLADVTVVSKSRRERKVILFRLDPEKRKESETVFLPAEIVTHIGKPMSEWEEKGWD